MQNEYSAGEQLVWMHINDETGQQLNDLVTVMGVRSYTDSAYYAIRIEKTGDAGFAWHDELHRFRPV